MTELTTMTPAEIATKVLEGIASEPGSLDMLSWIRTDQVVFRADDEPGCGTTLCAAGWICHAAGLTMDFQGQVLLDGGEEGRRSIASVAEQLVGSRTGECPWIADKETALGWLRYVADGGDPDSWEYPGGDN